MKDCLPLVVSIVRAEKSVAAAGRMKARMAPRTRIERERDKGMGGAWDMAGRRSLWRHPCPVNHFLLRTSGSKFLRSCPIRRFCDLYSRTWSDGTEEAS